MIIKATRIATKSGAGAVASHVLRGEKNEEIRILQGSEQEMHDAMRDASAHGAKYGLRHFKISPGQEMTSDHAREILKDLAQEFGFDESRATLLEHKKPRAGGKGFDRHWHAVAPEVDPVTGKVLDSSWMRPRHEKIARIAETKLGHDVVPGRWNAAVFSALENEGRHEVAARVEPHIATTRPESGYKTAAHQMAQRKGHDLPDDRLAVREAWERSDNAEAFAAALEEQGISIRQGDKRGVYIAERGSDFLGAVHRLVGERAKDVAQRLEAIPPAPEPPQPPKSERAPAPAADKLEPAAPTPEALTPLPEQPPPAAETSEPIQAPPEAPNQGPGDSTTPQKSAPKPSAGGGGSSPTPADHRGPTNDTPAAEDPTAGIEPPKPGDFQALMKYREKVAKNAQRMAERALKTSIAEAQKRPEKKGDSHGNHSGSNADLERAAAATAARIVAAFRRGFEEARAAHEIRAAVERFRIDLAAAEREILAGTYPANSERADIARASPENPAITRRDGPEPVELEHARNHEQHRATLALAGDYRAPRDRGTEPDSGAHRSRDEHRGESDAARAKAGQAFTDAAAEARLDIALRQESAGMAKLREATEKLEILRISSLPKPEQREVSRELSETFYAEFQAEKSAKDERLSQRYDATKIAGEDIREAIARNRGRIPPRAFEAAQNVRSERFEEMKSQREALKSWKFSDFLERESRKNPEALALKNYLEERKLAAEHAKARSAADEARIKAILDTNPEPNPADRDPEARGKAKVSALFEEKRQRQEAPKILRERYLEAARARGFVMKILLWETREMKQIARDFTTAEARADMRITEGDKEDARTYGETLANTAARTYAEWTKKPDVAQALEDQRLNGKARELAQTNPYVANLLKSGEPEKAREIIREREQQERERAEKEQQRQRNMQRGPQQNKGNGWQPPTLEMK